jgi:hypothetical protein
MEAADAMSTRQNISMSRQEAEQFLASQDRVILVANSGDGPPLGTPARARFESGTLVVSVPEADPIVAALAEDARACCIAEQFPSYYEIKSVIVHGTSRPCEPVHHGEASFTVPLEQLTTFDFGRLPEAGEVTRPRP